MRYSRFSPLALLIIIFVASCHNPSATDPIADQKNIAGDPIVLINQELAKDSLNTSLLHERARLYLDKGMVNEALGDLGKALEGSPEDAGIYITLADAYLMMGKIPSCLESLQKAEELEADNNEALLKLAEVYLILQDYLQSFEYVKKALELDTKNPRAYFIRGYALMETGDTLAAIRNMQNALDQDSEYFEAAVQLGMLNTGRNNALAEQYFQTAIGIDPNNSIAYYLLGLLYQDTEQMDEALKTYEKLMVIDPSFKEAYYNIGYINMVYYRDFQIAIDYFTLALEQDSKYEDAWYNRGYCYELSGDLESARKDYQKALEIKPNYDLAIKGMNRLDQEMSGN